MSLREWFTNVRTASMASVWVGLPVALLVLAGFYMTWRFVEPAPPQRVVIAAGMPGGAYDAFARQYAKFFGENGFELVVKPTAGAIENYELLADKNSGVGIAIVQGGTAPSAEKQGNLQAICSIYFEPLWVFYRGEGTLGRLGELRGKRLAVGAPGSGVRALAMRVLEENGIGVKMPGGTALMDLGGQEAADALKAGEVDAVFLVISPESAVVKDLVHAPGVKLMSLEQADAYSRRFDFLSRVTLYRGVMDLGQDIPGQDVQLIAPAAMLVGRKDLHHGTIELLVQAARAMHSGGTVLSPPGQFPSAELTDLPVSSDAKYYLKATPSRILGGLPFWMKSLLDRLLLLIIPLVALLLPMMRLTPVLYRWSIRSRIVKWYSRLRRVEDDLVIPSTRVKLEADLKSLDDWAKKLRTVSVPAGFLPDLYELRMHLERVREKVQAKAVATKE